MENAPEVSAVVAILAAVTGLIYALVKLLPMYQKKVRNSIAGLTFEERIAALEFGHMKLETNHLAHIAEDIRELRQDFERMSADLTSVRERIARLEARR